MSKDVWILLPDPSEETIADAGKPGMFPLRADTLPARAASPAAESVPVSRGLLAFVLLADTFSRGSLEVLTLQADSSPLTAAILRSRSMESLRLVLWRDRDRTELLGILDPSEGIRAAAQLPALQGLLPPEVIWAAEDGSLTDPTEVLNAWQRDLLRHRLLLLESPVCKSFAEALRDYEIAQWEQVLSGSALPAWRQCLLAAAALRDRPAFGAWRYTADRHVSGQNALLQALRLSEPAAADRPSGTWTWQDKPVARTSYQAGLIPVGGIPETLAAELAFLQKHDPVFRHELPGLLDQWREDNAPSLTEKAQSLLEEYASQLRTESLFTPADVTLTWPLDPGSPAVQTILSDAFGSEEPGRMAARCFTEVLTLVPDGKLGSYALESSYQVLIGTERFTVIPPLCDDLTAFLARESSPFFSPFETHIAFREGFGVEVSLLLHGSFELRLVRLYTPEEQVRLVHAPAISLWPSAPLDPSCWHAYYLSMRGACTLRFLKGGQWVEAEAGDAASVVQTDTMPRAVSLWIGGRCLGALLHPEQFQASSSGGAAIGALELGHASLRLALSTDGTAAPCSVPSLWHILLRADEEYDAEPLPVWELPAEVPAAVFLRSESEDPLPFVDGAIVPAKSEASPEAVGGLLWRTDRTAKRARRLLLRQAILQLMIGAALKGASQLSLRALYIPDSEQDSFLTECTELATSLSHQVGMPVDLRRLPCDALQAAGNYLRSINFGGSLIQLHIGAGSSDVRVLLRGMERAALSLPTGGGLSSFLTRYFARQPDLLREELCLPQAGRAPLAGEAYFREAVAQTARAGSENTSLDVLHRVIDSLIGTHFREATAILRESSAAHRQGSRVYALMILFFSARLTLVGLALERLRWDSSLSTLLPAVLPLCFSGRCAEVFGTFDALTQQQLLQFPLAAMGQGNPVSSLSPQLHGIGGMEGVLGALDLSREQYAPALSDANRTVPPEELLHRYLTFLTQLFPAVSRQLLPPALFQVPEGEVLFRAALQNTRSDDPECFIAALENLVFQGSGQS